MEATIISNSRLATYTLISPNKTSPRDGTIRGVAIHCTAGSQYSTAKQIAAEFSKSSKRASCNYAVGGDGSIALVVDERDRAWCTSNKIDHYVISIEVASDSTGKTVRKAAIDSLINLLADICRRNGIKELLWTASKSDVYKWNVNNMIVHRWFANKSCPGDTLYNMHSEIAARTNEKLSENQKEVDDLTEAEVKALIDKYGKDAIKEALSEMSDLSASAWAEDAIVWASVNGLTDGSKPGSYCTREQVFTILYRFWTMIKGTLKND